MWNITISTLGAKYMCIEIKNMYLATPMDRFEFMKIPIELIPDKFIQAYNLQPMIKKGYI